MDLNYHAILFFTIVRNILDLTWKGFLKSLLSVAYIIGLSRLFAYPSHRNNVAMVLRALLSSKKGLTKANTKNGSQQKMKALMMIPKVVLALRSFANWNLNFFWWLFVLGEVLRVANKLGLWCLGCFGFCLGADFDESIGHWDSLLWRVLKQRPREVLSKLHCKK